MSNILRIGTRDSRLAVWQATLVKDELEKHNFTTELVYIKSEGDIDLVTPLYAIGVQGIFTRTLDAALLSRRIDIAVHSMKDVPVQPAQGIVQAAVLPRASYKDIFVPKNEINFLNDFHSTAIIATSSIRRKAQWLHRYPNHMIENLRGNVQTRLKKVQEYDWSGAIFAEAGLERIELRPPTAVNLDWMLPAPAQGAIMVVCRDEDVQTKEVCGLLNDAMTALCTRIERDFLRTLMGGCSTPVSALAIVENGMISFKGNIFSLDGKTCVSTEKTVGIDCAASLGVYAAEEILKNGGNKILESIRYAGK